MNAAYDGSPRPPLTAWQQQRNRGNLRLPPNCALLSVCITPHSTIKHHMTVAWRWAPTGAGCSRLGAVAMNTRYACQQVSMRMRQPTRRGGRSGNAGGVAITKGQPSKVAVRRDLFPCLDYAFNNMRAHSYRHDCGAAMIGAAAESCCWRLRRCTRRGCSADGGDGLAKLRQDEEVASLILLRSPTGTGT